MSIFNSSKSFKDDIHVYWSFCPNGTGYITLIDKVSNNARYVSIDNIDSEAQTIASNGWDARFISDSNVFICKLSEFTPTNHPEFFI